MRGAVRESVETIGTARVLRRRTAGGDWKAVKQGAISGFSVAGPVGLAFACALVTDSLG